MRDFVHIRRFLTESVAITVTNALVSSRIDYCNSVLKSCYDYDLLILHGIQNSLCRIVTRTSRFSHIFCMFVCLFAIGVASGEPGRARERFGAANLRQMKVQTSFVKT